MIMSLNDFLIVAAILFGLGMAGIVINRKNVIALLMSIELILLAVNTNFIAFSYYLNDVAGQIFVFFILAIAAAESAIGLAILMVLYRTRRTINVAAMNTLKG
jgi:NADH-quinone oxidoreductase subunit K